MSVRISLLALLLSASLLCSCSSQKDGYANGVSCDTLSQAVCSLYSEGEYKEYTEHYAKNILASTSNCDDSSIVYSVESNDINEFGIFHAKDKKSAEELYGTVLEFIETMKSDQKAFIESYAPNELPKLDGAEVKRFGNYVVYAIASKDDRQKAFTAIASELRG